MYTTIYCEYYNGNIEEHLNDGNDGGDDNAREDNDGSAMEDGVDGNKFENGGYNVEIVGIKSTKLNIVNDDVDR